MNILFIGRNCQVGGGSTFRYRASLGLRPRGHSLSLVAQGGPMSPMFEALGVRHIKVPPTPFNIPFIVAQLRRHSFDVVHAVTPTAGDDLVRALRFVPPERRPAFVLSIHGVLPAVVQEASQNPCLLAANEMICFDEYALKRLRSIKGLENRGIHRVPRPVEEHSMPHGARDEALQENQLVMVSRLSKSKGETALRALDALENLHPEFPDLYLEIIGDGSMHAAIARRCEELNSRLGKNVASAPGFLVNPFPAMARARCVVGTAYVALEALFHGIPVVASGYEAYGLVEESNLLEAIACNFGDGYPGVAKKPSAELFENGFRRVLGHFSSSQGQAELGRMQRFLQVNHSIDAVATRLENIYQKAIDDRKNQFKA